MRGNVALILILLGVCYAFPTQAAESSALKCGVNEDRVWVYDSLSSFDVAVKLKCGAQVEVIGHEKGYVKIRTSSGLEGYVEAKALPTPPATEENDQNVGETHGGEAERPSVVAAARTKTSAGSASSVSIKTVGHSSTNGEATKSAEALPPRSPRGESADSAGSTARTVAAPGDANNSGASLPNAKNQKKPDARALVSHSQAKPDEQTSAGSAKKTADETTPAPTMPDAHTIKTKSAGSARAAGKDATPQGTGRTVAASNSSTALRKSGAAGAAKTSSSKAVTGSKAPVVAAAPRPAASAPATNIVLADNVYSEPVPVRANAHATASPRDPDEEEDMPMEPLENKENCKIYFSAYGLSPNQYKWMTLNRGKGFSGICPAPAPALVDFVVIFTHDADFFNGTMPALIHTDKNGFSDYTPLSTIDTAVVSPSDADKNRREYVWVFHTKRGTFDPAKFSPRRRPLFSTTESNKIGTAAGSRSAEDALRFIEQQGVGH